MTAAGDFYILEHCISTHTLTWSVTNFHRENLDIMNISTHTLTWSVTFAQIGGEGLDEYFNSHAHVERDETQVEELWGSSNFNSHAHVERDAFIAL